MLDPAASAFAEAAEVGDPVEVEALRDEFSQTFAHPDGATLTREVHSAAQFGTDESGELVDIDTTLMVAEDGTVRPKAAALDLALPSDEVGSLRVGDQGREFELSFEGDLGAPELDGDTATYGEVLPGVDLKITALPEGFRQVYVVKTPESATDPRLDRLSFPVATENGSIQARADGGIMFVDPVGEVVFSSDAALMWDSSGEHTGLQSVTGPGGDLVEDFVAPSPGDVVEEMPVRVGEERVTVTPAADMMTDPDTEFPVYIDPSYGRDVAQRTMLRSNGGKDWQYTGSEGLGQCPTNYSTECAGTYKKRLFYQFGRGYLNAGDKLVAAEFSVKNTHSVSCTAKQVVAHRTDQIFAGSTWPGPVSRAALGSRTFAYGRAGCSPGGKDFELSTSALLAATQSMVNGDLPSLTVGLRAGNESEQLSWKRFSHAAVLRITFYRRPGVPTHVGVSSTGGCKTDIAAPMVVDTRSPSLYATVRAEKEPRADTPRGLFRARFIVERREEGVGWIDALDRRVPQAGDSPAGYAHGRAIELDLAALGRTLQTGALFRLRAQSESLYDDPANPNRLLADTGPASAPCYFWIDPDAPAAPTVTSVGNVYPREVNGNIIWAGGPGKTGQFTFTPAPEHLDDDPNIRSYSSYLISDDGVLEKLPAGAKVTPRNAGPHALHVTARDIFNRDSAEHVYHFNVKEDRRPIGYWPIGEDDAGETTLSNADQAQIDPYDADAPGETLAAPDDRTFTLSSSSLVADPGFGRRGVVDRDGGIIEYDRALRFTAAGGYAVSDTHLIDTAKSFSVSTWARLDDNSSDRVLLAQRSVNGLAGFDLRYSHAQRAWAATWKSTTGGYAQAIAPVAAVKNVWTQVAAVYDDAAGTLTLNLNGRPVAVVNLTGTLAPTATNGRMVLGAASTTDTTTRFRGLIDEIHVWRRAVPAEVLAKSGAFDEERPKLALAASWDVAALADPDKVGDKSVFDRADMTIINATKDIDNGHVVLDGTGGLTTTGPVVDETGAFTVTTHFRLDPHLMAGTDKARIVGQQSDAGNPSWALWFVRTGVNAQGGASGVWQFGRWNRPPGPGQSGSEVIATTDPEDEWLVELGSEVQVSVVHDPWKTGAEICVFAGSDEIGCTSYNHPVQGSGELTAAMSPSATGGTDFLAGHLRCVNIWTGAATATELFNDATCS